MEGLGVEAREVLPGAHAELSEAGASQQRIQAMLITPQEPDGELLGENPYYKREG
jgi:hypothetical protein